MNCKLNVMNCENQTRAIPFGQFFLGYRKIDLRDDEILISITIPLFSSLQYPECMEIVQSYKQSKRREDDIAIVNAGIRMVMDKSGKIHDCGLSFGGMAVCTLSAKATQEFLKGRTLDQKTFEEALQYLKQDLPLKENSPGGMNEYRSSLTFSFLFKFYINATKELGLRELSEEEESVLCGTIHKPYPTGKQVYQPKVVGTSVGKPISHNYSHLQVTGEATYVQDIPTQPRELVAYPVFTTKPYAKIKKVDVNRALTFEGVISWVDYRDVRGSNLVGAVVHDDEELFISKESTSCGQIIGFILGETQYKAMAGAKAVHVEYEDYDNPILSIEDALQYGAPVIVERKLHRGNSQQRFEEIRQQYSEDYEIIEGDFNMGGQEHFYFETQRYLLIVYYY